MYDVTKSMYNVTKNHVDAFFRRSMRFCVVHDIVLFCACRHTQNVTSYVLMMSVRPYAGRCHVLEVRQFDANYICGTEEVVYCTSIQYTTVVYRIVVNAGSTV